MKRLLLLALLGILVQTQATEAIARDIKTVKQENDKAKGHQS